MKIRTFNILLLGLLAAVTLNACGGNDDGNSHESARVVSLDSDTNPVGASGAIISVNVSFSSDEVFDNGENVVVVLHLPPQLALRGGTAEIDSTTGEDRDVGAQGLNCGAEGIYYLFDLDSDDLALADNPSGDADAKLKFTVDRVSAAGAVTIAGIARNNSVSFACGSSFPPDSVLTLTTQ